MAVYRDRGILQEIRQGSDMVFMSMGEDNAFKGFLIFNHIGKIRDDLVNARGIVLGKHDSSIHYDGPGPCFYYHGIQSEFSDSAQRYYLDITHASTPRRLEISDWSRLEALMMS